MDTDLLFVVGLFIAVLAAPAIIGSFTHNQPPRMAAICILVGGGLMTYAAISKPGGYPADEIPDVVVSVIRGAIN